MSQIIPEQQPLIAPKGAAISESSPTATRRTSLWKVAVVLISTFLVGLGFSINATPSQKVYESVICCQRHYDDCSHRGFVHETLCEKDNKVQSELAEITSGLAGYGGAGILFVPLWMAIVKSQNPIRSLFWAQLSAVLGEVSKAGIAFKNGGIPLRLMWLISPLEAASGITYTVLVGSLIPEITPPHFISFVMFVRSYLEAHLAACLGDALIASVHNALAPFSCVCLGLAFQLSGVLSLLLLGLFSCSSGNSPADQEEQQPPAGSSPAAESMISIISPQNDLQKPPKSSLVEFILQSLLSPLKTLSCVSWSTRLLCLTSLVYNPLLFASSTLGRQYLHSPGKPQFNLGMSEISAVYASARGYLLVILLAISACSTLMLSYFPGSLSASRRRARDLAVTGLLLLVASAGNTVLAMAGSKGVFGFGLVLTGLGAGYASMVESMLAIRSSGEGDAVGREQTTKTIETPSLLFTNQVVEAVGRVALVKVVSWLFSLGIGREGNSWKGEVAFYAAAVLALLAALAVAFAAWLGEPDTRAVSGDANSEPRGIEDEVRVIEALGDCRGVAAVNAATPLLGGGRRG